MHKIQVQELTVSVEENLRATVRIQGGEAQELYVDLYSDDELREAVHTLHNLIALRVGQGAKKCDSCIGTCCTLLAHNEIDLTRDDVAQMAARLGLTTAEVVAKYLVPMHSLSGDYQFVFVDTKLGKACPMLDVQKNRCKVYEARPMTCRAFSADACDLHRPKVMDVTRVRWGGLLPTDKVCRKAGGSVVIKRKA